MDHYAYQNKKNKDNQKKHVVSTPDVDEFASWFENEFSLIACLSSSVITKFWYIDNGAHCHMKGVKDCFSNS